MSCDRGIPLPRNDSKKANAEKSKKRSNDDGWGGEGMHGYMKEKERKLEEQFQDLNKKAHLQQKSDIFSGVCIFVNGYTKPSSDHLKQMMADHGGRYQHYYSKRSCTHIIATNLPDSKIKDLKKEKVVHPDWILESIEAGKRLPVEKYRLYFGSTGSRADAFANFQSIKNINGSNDVRNDVSNFTITNTQENDSEPFKEGLLSMVEKCQNSDCIFENKGVTNSLSDSHCDKATNASFIISGRYMELSSGSDDVEKHYENPSTVGFASNAVVDEPQMLSSYKLASGKFCDVTNDTIDSVTLSKSDGITDSINDCASNDKAVGFADGINDADGTSDAISDNETDGENHAMNVDRTDDASDGAANDVIGGISDGGNVQMGHCSLNGTLDVDECIHKERNSVVENNEIMHFEDDSNARVPNLTKHNYSDTSPSKSMGKAGDPGFMSDFYSNSRLHHLSMWRSELKRYATMIHKASTVKKQARNTKRKADRCIMHVDMDSFFVSVALKERPELRGKPVAVCHASKGATSSMNVNSMSEIASCSYEARSKGVRNGMFLGKARSQCPELICVPYYFESYRMVSQKFYEILVSYTCEIEAVSCDEALLDVTDLLKDNVSALDLAIKIRAEVLQATGCKASAGIASNILLARMSTRKAKPDGQFHLQKEDVLDFVDLLKGLQELGSSTAFCLTGCQKVSDLPGVGYSMQAKLLAMGVSTCADLRLLSLQKLHEKFGPKTGQSLYNNCRGLDDRQIKTDHERQSVSAEINYGIRFVENQESHAFLHELAKEVHERLQMIQMKGSHITLKLMIRKKGAPEPLKHMGHGICDNASKSNTILQPTADASVIAKEAINLLQLLNVSACDIRGMGIQVAKLVDAKTVSKKIKTISFSACSKRSGVEVDDQDENGTGDRTAAKDSQLVHNELIPSKRPQQKEANTKDFLKPSPKKRGRKAKRGGKSTAALSNFIKGRPVTDGSYFERTAPSKVDDPPLPSFSISPQKQNPTRIKPSYDLPPLSEIDPDVFYQLPVEVRKSIAEEYKQRDQVLKVEKCPSKMPLSAAKSDMCATSHYLIKQDNTESRKQGCANLLRTGASVSVKMNSDYCDGSEPAYTKAVIANQGTSKSRAESIITGNIAGDLDAFQRKGAGEISENFDCTLEYNQEALSLSTIDPDVMGALPEHLQREIMQNIKSEEKRIKRNREKEKDVGSEKMRVSKQSTLYRGIECHGLLPRETETDEHVEKDERNIQNQQSLQAHLINRGSEQEVSREEAACFGIQNVRYSNENSENGMDTHRDPIQNAGNKASNCGSCNCAVQLPSLDGETNHHKVKELLKAWIRSTDEPFPEDLAEFETYITGLLSCNCMEQAFLLLKLLKRLSTKSDLWVISWESINNRVQQMVESRYGGTLSL